MGWFHRLGQKISSAGASIGKKIVHSVINPIRLGYKNGGVAGAIGSVGGEVARGSDVVAGGIDKFISTTEKIPILGSVIRDTGAGQIVRDVVGEAQGVGDAVGGVGELVGAAGKYVKSSGKNSSGFRKSYADIIGGGIEAITRQQKIGQAVKDTIGGKKSGKAIAKELAEGVAMKGGQHIWAKKFQPKMDSALTTTAFRRIARRTDQMDFPSRLNLTRGL